MPNRAPKRIESEVVQRLSDLGETQRSLQLDTLTVTPAQFLGLEVKEWAAAIAELVLWIGHLQWFHREHPGTLPPEADFIVGNSPFLGNKRMREALGDGYAEALRKAYSDVPDSVDFVMYWWHRAAEAVRCGKTRRFGLITTNSLPQTFNRKVIAFSTSPFIPFIQAKKIKKM